MPTNSSFDTYIAPDAMQVIFSLATSCLFASTFFLCTNLSGAEEFQVTFHLHAPDMPANTKIYLAGNLPSLGKWNPKAVRMQSAGNHLWTHHITLSKPRTIEYKYTLGTWAKEGADATGRPLQNFVVTIEKSKEIHDHIDSWTNRKPNKPTGQITGTVRYHRDFKLPDLRTRDVLVWLPPDYDNSDTRYPVLYMHDGQNLVDPSTSAFGIDWQIDETCTQLIKQEKIKPLIVVGIYNTPDRSQEYLPSPKCTTYMQAIVENLKPMIDATYRTKPSREHTYAGGSSAGGLCAFMLVWEHSAVFSKAICMSPAFKVKKTDGTQIIDYVATVSNTKRPAVPVYFYIDNGGLGGDQRLQPGIDQMLQALHTHGFQPEKDYHWHHAPQAHHSEPAWAKRFPVAIQTLIGKTTRVAPTDVRK